MNLEKEVTEVPVELIIPNRFQPRLNFDETSLSELSQSIKNLGIIQPIVVRKLGDKYEIIAGERRFKAANMAGLTKVPVIISNYDDKLSAEAALAENVQRKDLSPIEEALSYQKLLEKNGLTQDELAKTMGVSQSTIANKLRLLALSPRVQEELLNEKITERHARALLTFKEYEIQDQWLQRIIKERLTVKQLDDLIKKDYSKEDEVPIIKSQNIEDIINNTSDIVQEGIFSDENSIEIETNQNESSRETTNHFNDLENEPIVMQQSKPVGLFDEVEFLDIDEEVQENNDTLEKELETSDIYIAPKEKEITNDLPDILKYIRELPELYKDTYLEIQEADLEDSYTITIKLPKE